MMGMPWREDGTLRIEAVDQEEFKVVAENGLVLVHPRKNKFDWSDNERWLRSVVVRASNGTIVSTGWPKFGNDGEFAEDSHRLRQALERGEPVRFTYKEDGSLCIRDVVDGQVMMRTRGTMWGGERGDDGLPSFGERFAAVARQRYPQLLDPSWHAHGASLLFEYVGPDNRVVVRYNESDLILLGIVDHTKLEWCEGVRRPVIRSWPETAEFAQREGLRAAETADLPMSITAVVSAVEGRRAEGIVVRCRRTPESGEDQILVKVKSAWYLANHRMRHSMNYQRILEFVEANGIRDEAGLVALLKKMDFDFEIIQDAKQLFALYAAAIERADCYEREAARLLAEFEADCQSVDGKEKRKQLAAMACAQPVSVKSMIFALYDGNTETLDKIRARIVASGGDE